MGKNKFEWVKNKNGEPTRIICIRGRWYRCKSEVLILKPNGSIFLAFHKDGKKYTIPGGGWSVDDIDDVDTVIRETLEEAHMKICDIHYKTSYINRYKNIDQREPWIGEFIKLYVATYDGTTDFQTRKEDINKLIKNHGKWYVLKKIYPILKAQHQEALKDYIG